MTAIEFENISKQYRLGLVSTKTLAHDLNRFWQTRILGHEDPYLKIGETNDRSSRGSSEYVWALKDINFRVEQGDVVGIIGKNGAGKSTLLKLLSQVTGPTTGTIRARGRIGSLLEVGTGFHTEMTGRENIYLNGAILGMTRYEVKRKLDEIVDFSGCERYLDTPVKRYSSGMLVRLGFAVAAHLDPEILVVDEVLAVGDAEFQRKAIGKMQDVSKGEGRTVLFVSHNMTSIRNLCKTGIILEKGQIVYTGDAESAVDTYIMGEVAEFTTHTLISDKYRGWDLNKEIELVSAKLLNKNTHLRCDESIEVELELKRNRKTIHEFNIVTMVLNSEERHIASHITQMFNLDNITDIFKVRIRIDDHHLSKGPYFLNFKIGVNSHEDGIYDIEYDEVQKVLSFEIAYNNDDSPIDYWSRHWGNFHLSKGEAIFIKE